MVATVKAALLSLAYLGDFWMVILFLCYPGGQVDYNCCCCYGSFFQINLWCSKVEFTSAKFDAFWGKNAGNSDSCFTFLGLLG